MKLFTVLFFTTGLLITAGTAEAQHEYTLTVSVEERAGDNLSTSTSKYKIAVVDGPMELPEVSRVSRFLVDGTLQIGADGSTVRALLSICEPRRGSCEPMSNPKLSFLLGDPVAWVTGTDKIRVSVRFDPVVG